MMLNKDKLSDLINVQVGLVSSYLSIAAKNIETDALMAQDYQMMAKEAAATVEILQRIILIEQLSKENKAALRDRFDLPPHLNVSYKYPKTERIDVSTFEEPRFVEVSLEDMNVVYFNEEHNAD